MTFYHLSMFHDFSMVTFVSQIFQSLGEPCGQYVFVIIILEFQNFDQYDHLTACAFIDDFLKQTQKPDSNPLESKVKTNLSTTCKAGWFGQGKIDCELLFFRGISCRGKVQVI